MKMKITFVEKSKEWQERRAAIKREKAYIESCRQSVSKI